MISLRIKRLRFFGKRYRRRSARIFSAHGRFSRSFRGAIPRLYFLGKLGGHRMSHTIGDCAFTCSDGAAPLGKARQHPVVLTSTSGRLRRRGSRSQLSRLRRSVPKHRRTLPGTCLGESRHSVPDQSLSNVPRIDFQDNSNSALTKIGV